MLTPTNHNRRPTLARFATQYLLFDPCSDCCHICEDPVGRPKLGTWYEVELCAECWLKMYRRFREQYPTRAVPGRPPRGVKITKAQLAGTA